MKVRVGSREFEIRFMDRDWMDDSNLHGRIIYADQDIKIAKNTDVNTAIIHEVLHWLDYSNGWGLTERKIVSLGIQISDLIRDNPQFDFRKDIKPEVK